VWELTLLDAADYLRERMRAYAAQAQLLGAVLLSPLMPESERGQVQKFLASFEPARKPMSLVEEFGEQEAAEMEAMQERARKWAEQRMK